MRAPFSRRKTSRKPARFSRPDEKSCRKCGETKQLDEFPPRERSRDGRGSWCRACHRAASAKWRRQQTETEEYTLPSGQYWELLCGVGERSHFDSDEERRAAWETHREALIDDACEGAPGRRPAAWWEYEAGRPECVVPYPYGELGPGGRQLRPLAETREAIDEHYNEPGRGCRLPRRAPRERD